MKEIYQKVLDGIPDEKVFLTLDELEENSRKLAAEHPECVSLFNMGKTRSGRDLMCMKIGQGSKNALMFGCPHPNEPIGTMMLEYFSRALAEDGVLRAQLDYTWYIVKAWDADGLHLNEGWLKGPYDIYHYSRHFFRPAGHKQVDWTFPIDYKNLHFHEPIPETQAMMELIDNIKPHFIYSLHNAGFGGVYWYISSPLPKLYEKMRAAALRVDVPLNLGEPEAPYCIALSPAIYSILGIEQNYDYLEKYGTEHPEEHIKVGTCSASYAKERHKSFTLLTELPYFYDKRIMDLSESTVTRREAVLDSLRYRKEKDCFLKSEMAKTALYIDPENPFRLALEAFTRGDDDDAVERMANEDPDYQRLATVAEVFDNTLMTKFYATLTYGMLIRMNEFELDQMLQRGDQDEAKGAALREAIAHAEGVHRTVCDELEDKLDYQVVPIRKLVSIQLETGLLVADFLSSKEPA